MLGLGFKKSLQMIPRNIQNMLEKGLEEAVFFREILILECKDDIAKWEKTESPKL